MTGRIAVIAKAWVGQERPDRTAQILQKHKGLYTAGGEQFSFSRMSQINMREGDQACSRF